MAECSMPPVPFENALKRENARQKRHREWGLHLDLSRRLDEHEPPQKKKKRAAKKTANKETGATSRLDMIAQHVFDAVMKKDSPPPPIEEDPIVVQEEYKPPPTPPFYYADPADGTNEVLRSYWGDNPNWHEEPPQNGESYTILESYPPLYEYTEKKMDVPPPTPMPLTTSIEDLYAQLLDQNVEEPKPRMCPFHQEASVFHYVSAKGWPYYMCSFEPCAVFMDAEKAPTLLVNLQLQKHEGLKVGKDHPPLTCFCQQPLTVRVSQTKKNPGRLFLACKKRACDLFQWVNEPWSPELRSLWAQANPTV